MDLQNEKGRWEYPKEKDFEIINMNFHRVFIISLAHCTLTVCFSKAQETQRLNLCVAPIQIPKHLPPVNCSEFGNTCPKIQSSFIYDTEKNPFPKTVASDMEERNVCTWLLPNSLCYNGNEDNRNYFHKMIIIIEELLEMNVVSSCPYAT